MTMYSHWRSAASQELPIFPDTEVLYPFRSHVADQGGGVVLFPLLPVTPIRVPVQIGRESAPQHWKPSPPDLLYNRRMG